MPATKGNWAAVGRFDWLLGPYLKKDLERGAITLAEAREYVAHFWIKGCEGVDTVTCIGHDDGGFTMPSGRGLHPEILCRCSVPRGHQHLWPPDHPGILGHRTANPDGHKKGDFLSNNISPAPGTDLQGATATLRSYGSLDMKKLSGGTALESKMSCATVRGEDGLEGLVDLFYAFCDLGCHFMQ